MQDIACTAGINSQTLIREEPVCKKQQTAP